MNLVSRVNKVLACAFNRIRNNDTDSVPYLILVFKLNRMDYILFSL